MAATPVAPTRRRPSSGHAYRRPLAGRRSFRFDASFRARTSCGREEEVIFQEAPCPTAVEEARQFLRQEVQPVLREVEAKALRLRELQSQSPSRPVSARSRSPDLSCIRYLDSSPVASCQMSSGPPRAPKSPEPETRPPSSSREAWTDLPTPFRQRPRRASELPAPSKEEKRRHTATAATGLGLRGPAATTQKRASHPAVRIRSPDRDGEVPRKPFSVVLAESRRGSNVGTAPRESLVKQKLRRSLAQRQVDANLQELAAAAETLIVSRAADLQEVKEKSSLEAQEFEEDIIEGRQVSRLELDRWNMAFTRFLYDGEMHRDDLKRALPLCGYDDVRDSLTREVLANLTNFNTLDKHEFSRFVCMYETCLYKNYHIEFHTFDQDDTGSIDAGKIKQLLSRIGLNPRTCVVKELLTEVDCHTDRVDFKAFDRLQHLCRKRDSFMKSELEEFSRVFRNFDRDNSGDMGTAELGSAITWLGFPVTTERMRQLYTMDDEDGDGSLSEAEFVLCLRRVYEDEASKIQAYLASRSDCKIRRGQDLEQLLQKLSYDVSPQAVLDACHEAKLHENASGAGFSLDLLTSLHDIGFELNEDDVLVMLKTLRARHLFTHEEIKSLQEAFKRHNSAGEDIAVPAIGKALRWLGHSFHFDVVQKLVAEIDVDGDHALDFTMFVKLVRKCKDLERKLAVDAFTHADTSRTGALDKQQQLLAFHRLNCVDQHGDAPVRTMEEINKVNLQEFLAVARRFRAEQLESLREHNGFSEVEMEDLRRRFQKFDKDRSGSINRSEIARLIEVLLPERAHSLEFRPFLTKLLAEVDQDGSDSLDFGEFTLLMRSIYDYQDEHLFKIQMATIHELGFSYVEANEFRALFVDADKDGSSKLSLAEIKAMLGRAGFVDEHQADKLRFFFDSVVKKGSTQAGFFEFLHIMRKVIDAGWYAEVSPKGFRGTNGQCKRKTLT